MRIHDEYLLGIAEVSNSWPAASLQAQVLAARSYILSKASTLRSACLCHVDDGGGPYYDQTFLGRIKVDEGPYSANWRAAVDTTAVTATTAPSATAALCAQLVNLSGEGCVACLQSSNTLFGGMPGRLTS